jgi:hypothetical protein
MNSSSNPKQTDAQHGVVTRADERLMHAYEQITRADEQLERVHEQLSRLEHDAARRAADTQNRLAISDRRPAVRGLIALILAACISAAAIAWQSSYGDAARLAVAHWVPQFASTSSPSATASELPGQPNSSAVQVAAAQATAPPSTPQPFAPPDTSAAVPVAPELMQLLQTIEHEIANVEQQVERLKATQEQMVRDNAQAAEQLKASQEQLARDNARAVEQLNAVREQMNRVVARASEQKPRPKTSSPAQRPSGQPVRRTVQAPPPPQARAHPQPPPIQLQPDDQ